MDRWCVPAELPPLLLSLRCRGGQAHRAHRLRPVGEVRWRPSAVQLGRSPLRRRAAGTGRVSRLLFGRCLPYAAGGGRPRSSGDNGFGGAQHRGDQRRQVEAALAGGAHDAGEDLLGVGAVAGAVAAAHLADDHGGPDGLFGAPVGGVERGVPQEQEHGREFGGQVRRKALGVVERRRGVDQPTEPGGESAAGPWPSRARSVLPRCSGPAGRGRPAGPPAPRPAQRLSG